MPKKRPPTDGGANEQTEILRGIWNEVKALNGRIDRTNDRLDAVRTELKPEIASVRTELKAEIADLRAEVHQGNERVTDLHRLMIDKDLRLSTEVTELAGHVSQLVQELRKRPDRQSVELEELRQRVARLEERFGADKT
jgi:chromosome segregation ATPase